MICPLKFNSESYFNSNLSKEEYKNLCKCEEEECAWFIESIKGIMVRECAIKTIARMFEIKARDKELQKGGEKNG